MGLAFRITGNFQSCCFLYGEREREEKEDVWLFACVYVCEERQKIPWQTGQLDWQIWKCEGEKEVWAARSSNSLNFRL